MKTWLTFCLLALSLFCIAPWQVKASDDPIMSSIADLESRRDPKCYATASRLEDFMFGTPLTDEARFKKNQLQTQWARTLWREAGQIAKKEKSSQVQTKHVDLALARHFVTTMGANGDRQLVFPNQTIVSLLATDVRHYGTIAYGLRALLAVRQQLLLQPDSTLVPLSQDAVQAIKTGLDLFSLAALQRADQKARMNNAYHLDQTTLVKAWTSLDLAPSKPNTKHLKASNPTRGPADLSLLQDIIDQKVAAFKVYNEINNTLFVRNLQVYFARASWPRDKQEANQFRETFTSMMVAFARDLYVQSQTLAKEKKQATIGEQDVSAAAALLVPHHINAYEDALFFGNLETNQQVAIEAYDMDAFRDSGIHWRYLQFAMEDFGQAFVLPPDPFAAELLVENIAQYGVLLLRLSGEQTSLAELSRLKLEHLVKGQEEVRDRAQRHHNKPKQTKEKDLLASTGLTRKDETRKDLYFTDVTSDLGIHWQHRSSDWLNRLMRSYLPKDRETGIITIPPAFGGGGIAAEDINQDGLVDLLVLSGLGNKLFLNQGAKGFVDITKKAGLAWIRPQDNHPGEPRQPLIADLDNDGHQDIVITYVNDVHRVYRNKGDGTFEDVTERANLGGTGLVGGPATVFDFDRDGLLDIYITYFGDYLHGVLPTLKRYNENGLPNRLFRNKGNFVFEEVTKKSGLGNTGWGQAVTHTDLDGDHWQDLIVGNDFGVNAYYRNLGNGKFKDVSAEIGTQKPSYTMSISSADLNDDFLPDIYISNIVTMNKDEKYVLPGEDTIQKFNADNLANMRVIEANDLFLSTAHEGKMPTYHLSEVVGRGYSSTGWAWDADFFDADNDGDDDLYVLNGMNEFNLYSSTNPYFTDSKGEAQQIYIPVSTKETNVFFLNANGKLNNLSAMSGADLLGNSRSATYFDFDLDGDLDMALVDYHGPVTVYRNNGERLKNNWLKITLVGDPAKGVSRDAIGARLIASTPDGGSVMREVKGSTGYMSVHPKQQIFGLAKNNSADLKIIWPNGKTMLLEGIPANKTMTIYQTPPL